MTFLAGLLLGLFLGYAICDLLTKESSIVYHIKRLRAKDGAIINVKAKAAQTRAERKARKNK